MSKSKIVGAIEIGTGKVAVLVGEIVNGRSLNIISLGESVSSGVKKGEIINFERASQATHAAISQAEKSGGIEVESVYLSQTGRHLNGFYDTGSINVSASDHRVSKADISRVVREAKSRELEQNRVYIHHVQNEFKVDGRTVENPFGMEGRKLEVGYWSIHGDVRRIRDQIHIINGFGMQVEDMIVSSIASGCMVASDIEKKNGVLVIDIGCGTTDFVVYKDSYIVYTGVIAVGGDHFTNDISLGVRVSCDEAEYLKTEYGKAYVDEDTRSDEIKVDQEKRVIRREALYDILQARAGELFSLIRRQLEGSVKLEELAGGAIITGGTAQLSDITKSAEEVLGLATRVGENPSWASDNLQSPEYSTPLGLLHYALNASQKSGSGQNKGSGRGLLGKMGKFFKR